MKNNVILTVVLMCCISVTLNHEVAQGDQPEKKGERISVFINYKNQALLISQNDEIAIIDFLEPIKNGATYRYRLFNKTSKKEITGKGKVYEKYIRRKKDDEEPGYTFIDDGGQLFIKIGNIKIEWSMRETSSGWIYYYPKKTKIEIIKDTLYEKLTLSRYQLKKYTHLMVMNAQPQHSF